jgi:hypothetical protein
MAVQANQSGSRDHAHQPGLAVIVYKQPFYSSIDSRIFATVPLFFLNDSSFLLAIARARTLARDMSARIGSGSFAPLSAKP